MAINISGDAQGGSAAEMSPIGIIIMLTENKMGQLHLFSEGTIGTGWCGASIGVSVTYFYYTGNAKNFTIDNIA
ncbi:hypothetical protein G7051_15125 [Dysgonomonas sp. HDW5B]|uniref:hypothetical protein n=1 Tax=Dysgonomonas sp. HDW5B TaxID=2714927 RepID=UPI00140B9712|nr:hypothetical protein [Dysgonomonas sp. HDW5B]QIK55607.1 hypothetical protein G7051_15125 [Dysgonomonas sp. HDW5B]